MAKDKDGAESLGVRELRHRYEGVGGVRFLEGEPGSLKIAKFAGLYSVFRYTTFAYAKELLQTGEMKFVSPGKWEDPFERRFFDGKYKGYIPGKLACACFTMEHGENEAAEWKFRKSGDGCLVQLAFDFDALVKSLGEFAQETGATVYIEPADYRYTTKQLRGPGKDSFLQGVEEFGEGEFIRLLSLKRRAFSFEKELRVIIHGGNWEMKDGLLSVPMKKVVKVLKFEPATSAVLGDGAVQKALEKALDVRIERSRLYDDVPKFQWRGYTHKEQR